MLFLSVTSLVAKILVARPLQRVLKDESPDKQDRHSYAKPHPIPMSKGKYADKGCVFSRYVFNHKKGLLMACFVTCFKANDL